MIRDIIQQLTLHVDQAFDAIDTAQDDADKQDAAIDALEEIRGVLEAADLSVDNRATQYQAHLDALDTWMAHPDCADMTTLGIIHNNLTAFLTGTFGGKDVAQDRQAGDGSTGESTQPALQ